jgi:hypothetical protein
VIRRCSAASRAAAAFAALVRNIFTLWLLNRPKIAAKTKNRTETPITFFGVTAKVAEFEGSMERAL